MFQRVSRKKIGKYSHRVINIKIMAQHCDYRCVSQWENYFNQREMVERREKVVKPEWKGIRYRNWSFQMRASDCDRQLAVDKLNQIDCEYMHVKTVRNELQQVWFINGFVRFKAGLTIRIVRDVLFPLAYSVKVKGLRDKDINYYALHYDKADLDCILIKGDLANAMFSRTTKRFKAYKTEVKINSDYWGRGLTYTSYDDAKYLSLCADGEIEEYLEALKKENAIMSVILTSAQYKRLRESRDHVNRKRPREVDEESDTDVE